MATLDFNLTRLAVVHLIACLMVLDSIPIVVAVIRVSESRNSYDTVPYY